jgi:TolB protein
VECPGQPTWSPDGRRIAFTAWSARGEWSIWLINVNGKDLRELTVRPAGGERRYDAAPDWSPAGDWIVFERGVGGSDFEDVMAIRPNGTGLHRVAKVITGPQCACPDWSPDGSMIAYQASTTRATKRYPEIYVMSADGTGRTQLTFTGNRVRDENPDWSPDGRQLAFYSERTGNAEIFVIDVDGSHLRRVTNDPWYAALPRWRPAG